MSENNQNSGRWGDHKNRLAAKVLQFIYDHMVANDGNPPTTREIKSALKISSTSVVKSYLDHLEERGAIEIVPGKSRTIRIPGGRYIAPPMPDWARVYTGRPLIEVFTREEVDAAVEQAELDFGRYLRTFARGENDKVFVGSFDARGLGFGAEVASE